MVTLKKEDHFTVITKGKTVRVIVSIVLAFFVFTTAAEARHHPHYRTSSYDRGSIVSHPAGCPASLFCGCGAAVRVFGQARRDLFTARAWFRFPRTAPAPGMVAVRAHHVWVLESQVSGNTWVGYDANSGGHQTRIHARSLAGYVVVNPHG